MGAFLGGLASNIGQNALANATNPKRHPIGNAIYQSIRNRGLGNVGVSSDPNAMVGPPAMSPNAPGAPNPPGPPGPPDSSAGDEGAGLAGNVIEDLAAGGKLVTTPTIAKIGEKGPEAVIPLTPRAGNKLQPDILQGQVAAPSVPGMKLARYRGYNRYAHNSGGMV